MKLIKIGKLVSTHGLKGDLVMQVTTESPEVFDDMRYMMLAKGDDVKASLEILDLKDYKDKVLVTLKGVADIDSARKYRGMDVVVPEEMLPELEDGFYWHELEGSEVLDKDGEKVGTLIDYLEAGASLVFRIKGDVDTYLISNNKNHVLEINVKDKKLIVAREGLISENI